MRMTPYAQKFRGVASSHARLRYAGGSWRSPRSVGLSVPIGSGGLDGELGAGCNSNRAHSRCRQDANHNGHIPTAGAARLLDVLGQSVIVVIDGMSVSSAVGMHVRNLVMVRLMMDVTASKAVVIKARFFGRCVRGSNEGSLERERNYGRQHDGSREPSAERLRGEAQFTPPEVPFQPREATPSEQSWSIPSWADCAISRSARRSD